MYLKKKVTGLKESVLIWKENGWKMIKKTVKH